MTHVPRKKTSPKKSRQGKNGPARRRRRSTSEVIPPETDLSLAASESPEDLSAVQVDIGPDERGGTDPRFD